MKKMRQPDPSVLAARLNQPPTTLLEMLEQTQATIPLSESGQKLLEELRAASGNGQKSMKSSGAPSLEKMPAVTST